MPNTRRLSCFIGTLAGRRNEPGVFKGAGKADDFTAVGKVPEIPIIPVKTAEIFDSACRFPAQPVAGNTDRFRPDVSNLHTHRETHARVDVRKPMPAYAITKVSHVHANAGSYRLGRTEMNFKSLIMIR